MFLSIISESRSFRSRPEPSTGRLPRKFCLIGVRSRLSSRRSCHMVEEIGVFVPWDCVVWLADWQSHLLDIVALDPERL